MQPSGDSLKCPKCPGTMRSYERNGVRVEQCDTCRGIFLDFGELEALARIEGGQQAPAPAPPQGYPVQGHQAQPPQAYPAQGGYQPGWGGHGHGGHDPRYRKHGFGRLFFSS